MPLNYIFKMPEAAMYVKHYHQASFHRLSREIQAKIINMRCTDPNKACSGGVPDCQFFLSKYSRCVWPQHNVISSRAVG